MPLDFGSIKIANQIRISQRIILRYNHLIDTLFKVKILLFFFLQKNSSNYCFIVHILSNIIYQTCPIEMNAQEDINVNITRMRNHPELLAFIGKVDNEMDCRRVKQELFQLYCLDQSNIQLATIYCWHRFINSIRKDISLQGLEKDLKELYDAQVAVAKNDDQPSQIHQQSTLNLNISEYKIKYLPKTIDLFENTHYFTQYKHMFVTIKKIIKKVKEVKPRIDGLVDHIKQSQSQASNQKITYKFQQNNEYIAANELIEQLIPQLYQRKQVFIQEIQTIFSLLQHKTLSALASQFIQQWENMITKVLQARNNSHKSQNQLKCLIQDWITVQLVFSSQTRVIMCIQQIEQWCKQNSCAIIGMAGGDLIDKDEVGIKIQINNIVCLLILMVNRNIKQKRFQKEFKKKNCGMGIVLGNLMKTKKISEFQLLKDLNNLALGLRNSQNPDLIKLCKQISAFIPGIQYIDPNKQSKEEKTEKSVQTENFQHQNIQLSQSRNKPQQRRYSLIINSAVEADQGKLSNGNLKKNQMKHSGFIRQGLRVGHFSGNIEMHNIRRQTEEQQSDTIDPKIASLQIERLNEKISELNLQLREQETLHSEQIKDKQNQIRIYQQDIEEQSNKYNDKASNYEKLIINLQNQIGSLLAQNEKLKADNINQRQLHSHIEIYLQKLQAQNGQLLEKQNIQSQQISEQTLILKTNDKYIKQLQYESQQLSEKDKRLEKTVADYEDSKQKHNEDLRSQVEHLLATIRVKQKDILLKIASEEEKRKQIENLRQQVIHIQQERQKIKSDAEKMLKNGSDQKRRLQDVLQKLQVSDLAANKYLKALASAQLALQQKEEEMLAFQTTYQLILAELNQLRQQQEQLRSEQHDQEGDLQQPLSDQNSLKKDNFIFASNEQAKQLQFAHKQIKLIKQKGQYIIILFTILLFGAITSSFLINLLR